MGHRCVNYVTNERLVDEFLAQIEIISMGIKAEAVEGEVCFRIVYGYVTLLECDYCEFRCHCDRCRS